METFGDKIRTLRETNGLTLREVSQKLGIDISTLGKIEKNNRSANKDLIKKIANFYKVEEKELLISFISDKIIYEIAGEEFGEDALKVAEVKVEYLKQQNSNDNSRIN